MSETYRGPVRLRGDQQDKGTSTTDQRLLDSRGPSDWVHTDPWRVLRIQAEFVEGFGALAGLPRAVTVFGSARTKPGSKYYEKAVEIGAALADEGFAVITGGESWRVTLNADEIEVADGPGEAAATVGGEPAEVLLWLWRRLPVERVEVAGDHDAVAALHDRLLLATQ